MSEPTDNRKDNLTPKAGGDTQVFTGLKEQLEEAEKAVSEGPKAEVSESEEAKAEAAQPAKAEMTEAEAVEETAEDETAEEEAKDARQNAEEEEANGDVDADAAEESGDAEETEADKPEAEKTEEAAKPAAKTRKFGKKRRRKKRRKKRPFLTAFIVILAIAGVIGLMHLPVFNVTEISVGGNKAFTDDQVIQLSGVEEGKSIFRAIPFLVGHKIKKNYYFDEVHVKYHLPNRVEIMVHEQEGFAQILIPESEKVKRKQYVIVDGEGSVIEVSYDRRDVTLIRNITVRSAKPGRRISVKEKGTYRKAMKIIDTAQKNDMYFKRVELTGSRVKCDIFDDMFVKGRYGNLLKSLENGTLRTVVYRLYQQNVMTGTINIGDNGYCSFTPDN